MAKFFKSTADIVPIDYEKNPEGFLENVVRTPKNVSKPKPVNILENFASTPQKPESYTGTDAEWVQENLSGEPFQNFVKTATYAKELLDNRSGTDAEYRAAAQKVVEAYENYMGGVKRDRPQRLSGIYLSPDGREWNSWKPCANQYEVLNAVFNATTTSGKSMESDKVRRYREALTRVRQQAEEDGKPFSEQDWRAFDEKMAVALGYVKQEELDIENLKWSVKAEADAPELKAQFAKSLMTGNTGNYFASAFPMPEPKFRGSALLTEEEIEQKAKEKRERNLADATGKMHNDINRDRSVLTWLECADALSSSANGIIARAFLLGGDDEKVAGLEDQFRKLDDKEKGTVAHFVGLSRGKVLEGQWWMDAGRGLYRTAHEIFVSPLQFGYAWGRVPAAYMAGAIKGEDVSWQALSEETAKRLADEALWESSTEHLEYEDYSFAEKGMKGLIEQLPIWATLMLGGVAGRAATGVGAGLTALRMASAGAAVARTAGVASSVAGWSGKAMLAMWYANESMDRYVSEGAPLWRANVMSTLSGVGQAFCDSVQGEMLLGKGLMGRPFARARNQFCDLLAESGAHSFWNYMGVLATKEGMKAAANLTVGASLDVLGECYVEGVQKAIETLGLNLSVPERTLLQDVAEDAWTEFAESVPTMVFSVGAGHAVSTSTVFKAKQTFASYNEAIRSMRSLSGVFAKEKLPAQNVEFSIFTQTPDGRVVPSEAGLQKLRVAWLETKGNKERMKLLEGTRTGLTHSQAEMVNRLFMSEERIRRVGTIATAIKMGLASRTRTGEQFMWTPEGVVASIQAVLPDAKIIQEKGGTSVISINGIAIRLGKGDLNKDIEENIDNPTSGFLQSLWSTIKNKEAGKQFKSYEDFEKAVGEEGSRELREKLIRSHVLGGSGYFNPRGLGTVEVDGKKVPVVGDITIDKLFAKGTTPAHEIVHAVSYILKTAKVLTEEDIKNLRVMFGDPTKEDELFNEEVAAEAIESYIKVGGFLEDAEQKAGIGVKVAKPNAFNRVLQLLGDAMVSLGMQETEYNPAVLASDPKVSGTYWRGVAAQELVRKMNKADFTRLETDAAAAMAEPLRQEKANLESLVENPVKPKPRNGTAEETEQAKPESATEAQVEQQEPVKPVNGEGVQPTQMSGANEVGTEMSSTDESGAVVAENATTEPVASGEPVGNSDEVSGNSEQLNEEQAPAPTPVGKPTAEAEALSEKTGVRADVIAQVAQVALGDTAFQAVEAVDEAKEAQDKEDATKASTTVIDAFFDVKRSVEEVPTENILVNDRIMQFKRGADPKTGTTEADFIPKYIPSMTRPIRVMQFKDGKIEVITGRHRLDAARRSWFKTIPAIVYREADGMTVDLAKAIDATENVLDRKGSAQDWVSFFKNSGLTSQELDQLGIHGGVKNKKVRAAEAIGANGIDDVVSFALDPNTSETRFHALGAIALAPKGVQRALLDVMLNKGIVDPVQLERMGKVLADKVSEPELEQESLFGEDDEAMEYARIEGLGVSKIIRALERERETLGRVIAGYKDLVLRKETKERLGIKDVNDKEELIRAQDKVKLEIAEWQGVLSKEQVEKAYAIGKEEDKKAQKAKKDQTEDLGGNARVLLHNGKRQSTKSVGEKSFILEALSRVEDGLAPSVEEAFAKMLAEKDEAIKTEKSLAKKRPQISKRAQIEKARDLCLKDKDSWQLSTVAEERKKRGARYSLDVVEEAPSLDAITQSEREAHEVWARYHDANGNPKPGYRMAPNDKPSNLNEKQWIWVRTPTFMRWFGDWINDPENASKVVDENGEPKVVYHGSERKFWAFSNEKIGSHTDSFIHDGVGVWGRGHYFSDSKAYAESYQRGNSEGQTIDVYLNIRNPMPKEEVLRCSRDASEFTDSDGKNFYRDYQRLIDESIRKNGYDGVVANSKYVTEYVAFSPTQVKSATENIGTFDPDKRDIRYSIAPLYTGTWADYDKPSLHHVGTGEGSQVYGWGLYATDRRGIAERYAEIHKGRLVAKGQLHEPRDNDWEEQYIRDAMRFVEWGVAKSVEEQLEKWIQKDEREVAEAPTEDARKRADVILKTKKAALALYLEDKDGWRVAPANVYSQTWFTDREPGDESHLLDWFENVSAEQGEWIKAQAGKEGLVLPDGAFDGNAEHLYVSLKHETFNGSAKLTSEFLARAGIDGVKYPANSYKTTVKDGDKVGWNYVSFRDDNLRIDHKWENGVQRYSLAEAETFADKLEEERKKIEANGGKLVLAYHGTDHRGFTKFERTNNVGYYFAGTRATAGSYIRNGGRDALSNPGLIDYKEALKFLRKGNEDFGPGLKTKWVFKNDNGRFVWTRGYDTKEEAEAAKNADEHWKDHATVVKVDLMVDMLGRVKYYENGIPYRDVIGAYSYVANETQASGIYDVAVRMDNPLEIDAEGQNWNRIYVIPRDENTKVYTEVSVRRYGYGARGRTVLLCQDEFGEQAEYEYDGVDSLLDGVEETLGKAARAEIDAKLLAHMLDRGFEFEVFSNRTGGDIYVYNEREGDGLVVSQKSTREIETEANEAGYDGVIINNVVDVGGGLGSDKRSEDTVYISFKKNYVKSIDKITYADDGSIIPISQRLNWGNDGDMRFSLATQEQNDPTANLQREAEEAGKPAPTGVQKAYNVYYPNASEDVRALNGRRYSFATDAEAIIKKKRPDVKDVPAVVSELQKFSSSAERKAALHWFVRGAIRLPEDAPKVTQALGYAKRAKADALKYDSPMACMEDLHDFKPKAEPINPDTVPELSNKREFDYGVTVYDVEDGRAGQQAMRRIINTHFGEDANPWCLLQGDGKGNLTRDAWEYWNTYNALPKQVAFKDGKLVAFMATDRSDLDEHMVYDRLAANLPDEYKEYEEWYESDEGQEEQADFRSWLEHTYPEKVENYKPAQLWWDRQDKSHRGIPVGNISAPSNSFGIKKIEGVFNIETGNVEPDSGLTEVTALLPENPFGKVKGKAWWNPATGEIYYAVLRGTLPLPSNPYGIKDGEATYDFKREKLTWERISLGSIETPFVGSRTDSLQYDPNIGKLVAYGGGGIIRGEIQLPDDSPWGECRIEVSFDVNTGEVSFDVDTSHASFDTATGGVKKYPFAGILPKEAGDWLNNYLAELSKKYAPKDDVETRFSLSAEERIEKALDDADVRFSLRTALPPEKTGIGYKAFYLHNGKLYPPMVANPGGADTPIGVWLDADEGVRGKDSKTGRKRVKAGGKGTKGGTSGELAWRPGWHLGEIPYALQFNVGKKVPNPLGITNAKGEIIKVGEFFPRNLVWGEVEYAADKDYQDEAHAFGVNKNGNFEHAKAGLPYLPKDGSYKYRTNPSPATDQWIISGAMRVKRILTKDEVDELVRAAGREPQKVEPRYALGVNPRLYEDVEEALNTDPENGKVLKGGTFVAFCDAPKLFAKLEMPTGKVYSRAYTLRKLAKEHDLTAEQMASVSDVMASPVAIFADNGRGYILLTDVSVPNAEGNNAPLMVYLNPAENGDLEASAFSGKPSDVSRFVRLATAGEMLYVDSAKVGSLPIGDEVKQAITSGRVKPARSRGAKSAEDALNRENKRYALYWLDPSLEEDPTPIFAQVAAERVATAKLSGKVDPLDGQMYKDIFGVNPEAVARYVDEYLQKNGRAFQSTEELIQAIGAEAYARQRDNKSLDAYIAGFAEGAGQASYAAQLRVAQTEAMKQHMENISGADAWIMQCELGFSLSRTVLGMFDAERKMTKEQIAERVKKRRERARKKYLAAHKAEAGDKDAEELFEQDAATSKDWEKYREIFGDPEAMEREVERLKQEAQEQMNADKAEREAKRKKREENKKKKEGKKKKEKPDEEGKGVSINLEEKLTIPRDFLFAKGIDLADPETLMWFVQQYVMHKWMTREDMERTPEQIADDPRFVRDVQCTMHNVLHDLAIDLCYSANRDRVLKRADKILSAGSSLRQTRAIALAAFNAMHATLVREKRAEITQGIIDGIDGTIGRGRFSEKMEQNDRSTSGDFARHLSKIRSILKMSDAEILKQREKWDAIVRHRSEDLDGKQDELLTNKDFNEGMEWIALIDKYGNHNHLMPGELDDLRAELMESVKGELQHTLEERKKFQERIDAVKNAFLLGILDNAPKYKPERARSVFSKRFWEEAADAYQSAMHFFLGNLIYRSKDGIREKAKRAQEEIEIQLGQAADKKNFIKAQWMDAIAQEMREIYGSPRACVNALKQKIPEHLNDKIAKQGGTLTVGQVLMLYAYSQQTDDYHTNIKLHKRDSKDYLQAIRQCLTDKEIALLSAMRNALVAVFPALQKEYKDITGVTVYTTRNYFPVKMKMDEHLGGDFRFFSPIITAMQPRVRHNRDIDESVDALSLFVSRLEDYAHMLGYGKAGIFLRETLGSTEVLKAVRQAHGDSQYKRLINKTLDILAGTRAQKTSDGAQMAIFLKSSRWVSLASLSFNVVSACKQIVSAPMAGAHEDVGIGRASLWLLKAIFPDSETRRAWSILRSSPGRVARYGLGLYADLVDAFSGTGRFTAVKKFYDAGMSPITFGDAIAGMSCGAGYYLMKEREFMDMGYSQEEAQARAEALTWTLIANTQQSSRVQDQPQIVNNNKLARLALQFLNAPYQQSQFVVNAFQAMCRGEEGGARRFANAVCVMTVVTTFLKLVELLFDALFGKFHDKDDEEKEEMLKSWAIDAACTAVLNPVFNVPVVGETFHQTVRTLAEGKNRFYFVRTGIPVIDKINDVVRSVTGKLTKPVDWSEMDTVDWTRYGAEWLDLALKESLAPYRQLDKATKNWTEKSIIENTFDE